MTLGHGIFFNHLEIFENCRRNLIKLFTPVATDKLDRTGSLDWIEDDALIQASLLHFKLELQPQKSLQHRSLICLSCNLSPKLDLQIFLRLLRQNVLKNWGPGAVFTTVGFLCNLRISPISQSVIYPYAEKACQRQTL